MSQNSSRPFQQAFDSKKSTSIDTRNESNDRLKFERAKMGDKVTSTVLQVTNKARRNIGHDLKLKFGACMKTVQCKE